MAAVANAASVIEHLDTQTGLLRLKELETRVADYRKTLKLRHWTI